MIGNAASERQESILVNEGINDRDFTVGTSSKNLTANENTVIVKTFERCFNERIDREMSNFLIRLKTESRTQFWPVSITLQLLRFN